MADTTQFGHDQLGHILVDYLLEVPRFQRSYSWESANVNEFLADLENARTKDVDYFMGTVVFAKPGDGQVRRQIVDGQQRLATTAILYIAIRDRLYLCGRDRQAKELEKRFLRGYVISADADLERLILSGDDLTHYAEVLDGRGQAGNRIFEAYNVCSDHLQRLMGPDERWEALIEISEQLEKRVQVLVAEASDLPEAYVIFETLNDRGADLTTADLLKNYLFSSSSDYFQFVEQKWIQLETSFDGADDLVKFIRHEYASRHGAVLTRRLYRSIQDDVRNIAQEAKTYVERLTRTQTIYSALRDPESDHWNDSDAKVRDALYAYRRFGFESSFPVLISAFINWPTRHADKLLIKMAKWSVRAQIAGSLGGGTAEQTFQNIAASITSGSITNQSQVHAEMGRLIPTDEDFTEAFVAYGDVAISRAKYLLAMLDKAAAERDGHPEMTLEWHSRSVTIEHILPKSAAASTDAADVVQKLGNLALLERKLNKDLGSQGFSDKRSAYKKSAFFLTSALASRRKWSRRSINARTRELAKLACRAWPEE